MRITEPDQRARKHSTPRKSFRRRRASRASEVRTADDGDGEGRGKLLLRVSNARAHVTTNFKDLGPGTLSNGRRTRARNHRRTSGLTPHVDSPLQLPPLAHNVSQSRRGSCHNDKDESGIHDEQDKPLGWFARTNSAEYHELNDYIQATIAHGSKHPRATKTPIAKDQARTFSYDAGPVLPA